MKAETEAAGDDEYETSPFFKRAAPLRPLPIKVYNYFACLLSVAAQ